MKVQKAGCILLNLKDNSIGLVYREKLNDYSFPKGHLESGETLEECAIRETEEETGRTCKIIQTKTLPTLKYIDSLGKESEVHYYISKDEGKCLRIIAPEDKEELVWILFDDVENKLTYQSLKDYWNDIKDTIKVILKNKL